MSVITISREYGSEGCEIAERTASLLGYHLADKQTVGTLLSQYGLIEFDRIYDSVPAFWEGFDEQRMEQRDLTISMLNRTIQALAKHGNIIIEGRGSYIVLGGYADVLNVRIQAPRELRIRRVMEKEGIGDASKAAALVKENDRIRRIFIESSYNVHWENAGGFDMVIDTGKIDREQVAGWIAEAARALPGRRLDAGSRITEGIEVDPILEKAVAGVLGCERRHQD